MKNLKGSLILLITAIIWGSAFAAQTSGAENIGTFSFNALRSVVAALFLSILVIIRYLFSKEKTKWPVLQGVICGVILCAAMGFQQAGIAAYPEGVAASGRAGFLTATYVVMVAVFSVLLGKKAHICMFLSTGICLVGMYLLCMADGFSSIYLGDILELLCAVLFTAHIIVVDQFNETDSIKMSLIQFTMCALISGVLMLIFEDLTWESVKMATVPILYAGVMSSGVAYTLQMVGQKYAQPSVAAIIMSLESVFAALTGWLILNEYLSVRELLGCALVFAAVIIAQIPDFTDKKTFTRLQENPSEEVIK